MTFDDPTGPHAQVPDDIAASFMPRIAMRRGPMPRVIASDLPLPSAAGHVAGRNGTIKSISYIDMDGQHKLQETVSHCSRGKCTKMTREINLPMHTSSENSNGAPALSGVPLAGAMGSRPDEFLHPQRILTVIRGPATADLHAATSMQDYGKDLAHWLYNQIPRIGGGQHDVQDDTGAQEVDEPHSLSSSSSYKFVSVNGDGAAEASFTSCNNGRCRTTKKHWQGSDNAEEPTSAAAAAAEQSVAGSKAQVGPPTSVEEAIASTASDQPARRCLEGARPAGSKGWGLVVSA